MSRDVPPPSAPAETGSLSGRPRRRARAAGVAVALLAPLFIIGYFVALIPDYRSAAMALLLPGLAVLVLAGWRDASRASRNYFGVTVALGLATVVTEPFDGVLLAEFVTALASIIGLIAVLRTVGFPLGAGRYRRALDAGLAKLRRRRFGEAFASTLLGMGLGQLLAFAVVPLADQILGVEDKAHSRRASRWSGRGLSVTVLSAVAFPTVSILIDLLDIRVTAYLLHSVPLTLVCGVALLFAATRQRAVEPDGGTVANAGRSLEPGGVPPASLRPLWEVACYLCALVALVVVLSRVVGSVSYLGIISVSALALSGAVCLALAAMGERAPLATLGNYGATWWRRVGPEVYVFTGGGFLLYFVTQLGLLESLPALLLDVASRLGAEEAVYAIFSVLVFVLFMVGVHPTVSVFVIAFSVAAPGDSWAGLSMPLLALALMVGNVAGLMPSPFSAVSNLRASMSGTDVFRGLGENIGFGLLLLLIGNAYVLVIAVTQA